jgi:hypothetical protein
MLLLNELLKMSGIMEEKIPVRLPGELWQENEEDVKMYTPTTIYLVKKEEGKDADEYHVFTEEGDTRKEFAVMSRAELDDSFIPVRSNQTEDAEGFTRYREIDDVEAIKYTGDTVKVDLESGKEKLGTGDYLIRKDEGDEFVYYVEKARYFDQDYAEKK